MLELPERLSGQVTEPQAHGLRLSTNCPAKRLLDYFEGDSWDFDPGIAQRGHDMAAMFVTQVWGDRNPYVLSELAVPWGEGRWTCHVDVVDTQGGSEHFGPWELKSHIDSYSPNEDEIQQLRRYLWAIEKYHPTLNFQHGYLAIVNPSNYRVYGPFQATLTYDSRKRFDLEEKLTLAFMDDLPEPGSELRDDPRLQALCNCGKCLISPEGTIDADEEEDLRAHMLTLSMLRDEGGKGPEYEALRATCASYLVPGQHAKSDKLGLDMYLTNPKPREKVDWKGAHAAGMIPDEVLDALRGAGWVTTPEPRPALTLRKTTRLGAS